MRRFLDISAVLVGICLVPMVWILVKLSGMASDRLLPSPYAVFLAYRDIEPNIFVHCLSTAARLFIGFLLGMGLGVGLGVISNFGRIPGWLIRPSLQALRAVPAAAAVPFFLLWFGFSETGRLLLVVLAVAANVAIASAQILARVPERYHVFFRGFKCDGRQLVWEYALPMVAANILPTLRFSLALVIGAQIVSELLGAQVGLGYVLQSARSTFSLPAMFLAMILIGALTAAFDAILCWSWRRLIYWERDGTYEKNP